MQHVVQTLAGFMLVSVSSYKPCLVDFVGHVGLVCYTPLPPKIFSYLLP